MLDNLVYVRMNTMMMEKFNTLEAQDLEPINLDKLRELPEYVDSERDWENDPLDSINEFTDDVMIDEDLSWLDGDFRSQI